MKTQIIWVIMMDGHGNTGNDEEANNANTKTYLASSFSGTPRHLNDLAHNALTIVTELGDPDIFITELLTHSGKKLKRDCFQDRVLMIGLML
jgi:hypothetical protein